MSILVFWGCVDKNKSTITEEESFSESSTRYKDITEDIGTESSIKDEAYYKSKGYQVFSEYHIAVKCPATLKDASNQSNDDFDFNYSGIANDKFYQIMIIKISAGRKDMSKQEYENFLKESFGNQGGGKHVLWGDEELPAYLLPDYTQNGYKGRGIAVANNGMIYTFNIMTKGNLDSDFNSFTNNVKFLNKSERIVYEEPKLIEDTDIWNRKVFIVSKKTFFHRHPIPSTISKAYLVKGDKTTAHMIKNGFGYVEFTNKGIITKGWIDLSDVSFIDESLSQSLKSNTATIKMKTYTKYGLEGFSILYPNDWGVIENPNPTTSVFISAPQGSYRHLPANFNVIISTDVTSLERKFEATQAQLKQHVNNYNLLSKEYVEIEGLDAIRTDARCSFDGIFMRSIGYQFKKEDNTVYTITFTIHTQAIEEYYPLINQIINTFKLL